MTHAALEFDDVDFAWNAGEDDQVEVLTGFSLTVHPGEFISVLGPSGCGKSTAISLASGLERSCRGEIRWNGHEIVGPSYERGVIFQKPKLFPWCTVQQATEWGLRMRGVSKSQRRHLSLKVLANVGLRGHADRRVQELSGGMQQRVAIAQVLANDCSLILMDEPFSALDIQTKMLVQRFTLSIWKSMRQTIVLVTHDISEALLADRVIVLGRRPARILEDLALDLPRPRDMRSPKFIDIYSHLASIIEREVMAAATEDGSWLSAQSAAPVWRSDNVSQNGGSSADR